MTVSRRPRTHAPPWRRLGGDQLFHPTKMDFSVISTELGHTHPRASHHTVTVHHNARDAHRPHRAASAFVHANYFRDLNFAKP